MFSPVMLFLYYTTLFFFLTPLCLYAMNGDMGAVKVAQICFLSNIFIIFGYLFKGSLQFRFPKTLLVNPVLFSHFSFFLFFIFMFYTFYSFGGIPFLSVYFDAGAADELRGNLFKGRQGFEIALLYLSAFLSYVIIPVSVVILYHYHSKLKHVYLMSSLLFSVATLQKALILNMLFPLVAYLIIQRMVGLKFYVTVFVVLFLYFIFMIQMTGHGAGSVSAPESFFSSRYSANGAFDYFIWRFFAVPIYTAIDTIYVFENWLDNQHLLGASSTFLSSIFGIQRVEIERLVFEYQFGGYNPLANANTYFAVSMFLDFSWIGVVLASIFVGWFLKSMQQARDLAIYTLGYLFIWQIANGSIIGIMLSSGFLYVVFHMLFLRFKYNDQYVK